MTRITMDVHKTRSTLACRTPGMNEPKMVRCYTTREEIQGALSRFPRPWIVAVESSRQSPAVCKWLVEIEVDELHLVDAKRLHAHTEGRPKTDARDAKEMLDLLEADKLPECYLASEEVQDRRALSRGRQSCRSISTKLRCIIRAVLNQHGVQCRVGDLTGKRADEELERVTAQLPPLTAMMVRHYVAMLMHVEMILQSLDQQIRALVADDPVAQRLMELSGIGAIIAFGILSEIGEIERFDDPKRLNSYAGLAPKANDSDEHRGKRHLPQRCNKRLRHWAVAAAQSAANAKRSSRARRTYYRVKGRRNANVAKIAAARVLMQEVFYRWHAATNPLSAVA